MCLVCATCRVCGAPYGTHYDHCDVPSRVRPEPRVPRAAALEATRSKALDAWLRGAPLPNAGYRPPEPPEVM